MSKFFITIGVIVVVLLFASTGLMAGDMCFGKIGCIGATPGKHGSVTVHGP